MSDTIASSPKNAGWLRAIYFVILWIVCVVVCSLPSYFLLKETPKGATNELIYSLLPQLIGTLLAIYICRCLIDKQDFWSLGFQFRFKDFLLGCLCGILFITIGFFLLIANNWIDATMIDADIQQVGYSFLLFVVVALTEEFMCRTYFLNSLLDAMPKLVAVFVSSLGFGILHFFNPDFSWIGFFNICVAGLFMGLWYAYRRNIWFPVGVHLTWNFFQNLYGFNVSGNIISGNLFSIKNQADLLLTGGKFGIEGSLPCLLIFVVGTFFLGFYLHRNQQEVVQ